MTTITPARTVAYDVVLASFEDGAFTDNAFRDAADAAGLEDRDRAQAQRLTFGAVQRRGTTDAVIAKLAGRPVARLDPPVRTALRLGLYELLFSDASAAHATVDQAVELGRRGGAPHAAGLINAVMRRAVRERASLSAELDEDGDPRAAARAQSAPVWLAEMWWRELGPERARSLLAASNRPLERGLRVNTLRAEPGEICERLREHGVEVGRAEGPFPLAAPEMLVAQGRLAGALEAIERGDVAPQSRGSAAVVEVLGPQPGDAVLDLCAGPGVKTGQIAVRMRGRGEVISVEPDEGRAGEIAELTERLGVRCVSIFEADAAQMTLGRDFDRVLVDAPCSDLGVLASRPDARWRKSPKAIRRLAELQRRILLAAARQVRPGGVLVYATCTISREENEENVASLLEASAQGDVPRLTVEDLGAASPTLAGAADARFLQILPDRDATTGFFIARLRREAEG